MAGSLRPSVRGTRVSDPRAPGARVPFSSAGGHVALQRHRGLERAPPVSHWRTIASHKIADENGTRAPGAQGSDTRVPRTDGRNDPAIASRSTPYGGSYSTSVPLLALLDNLHSRCAAISERRPMSDRMWRWPRRIYPMHDPMGPRLPSSVWASVVLRKVGYSPSEVVHPVDVLWNSFFCGSVTDLWCRPVC